MPEYDSALLLANDRWHQWKAAESKALNSDLEFTRYIGGIPLKHAEALCADIRARRTESNPVCDQKTWAGTYRIAAMTHVPESDGQKEMILETLRKGFLTTLDQTEARNLTSIGDAVNATHSWRQGFVYVDPKVLVTLLTTMTSTATVVDPQADGVTYTGTWAVGKTSHEQNDDGSVTLWRMLTPVTAVSGTDGATITTALNALPCKKEIKQRIIRSFENTKTHAAGGGRDPVDFPAAGAANDTATGMVDTANNGVTSKILAVQYDYMKSWSGLSPAQASLDAINGVTAKEWEALAPERKDAVNDDFTPPETKNSAPPLVAPETIKHFHFVGKSLTQDEQTGAYTLTLTFSDDENHKKEFYFQFTDKDRGLVKTKALYDATDADVAADAFISALPATYNNSFSGGRDPATGLINIEVTSHPHKSGAGYNYHGYNFSGDLDIRGVLRTATVTVSYHSVQFDAANAADGSDWPSYGGHKVGVQEVIKGIYFEATKITLD